MITRSLIPPLTDIVEAIERIRDVMRSDAWSDPRFAKVAAVT